jgi:hypothetical protein
MEIAHWLMGNTYGSGTGNHGGQAGDPRPLFIAKGRAKLLPEAFDWSLQWLMNNAAL